MSVAESGNDTNYKSELLVPFKSSNSRNLVGEKSKSMLKVSIPTKSKKRQYKYKEFFISFLRILFSSVYLIYIILTIPLSFEVGGINCGLSYSITILILYFCLATFRVLKYHRFISSFLYYMQHLLLPTLLSFFLSIFKENDSICLNSIFERIWWLYIVKFWKIFLMNSTPLFTILEGFCSLLSIQALGQVSKYIKNKSDNWSIINLILSACIFSTSIFFVLKIYASPLIDLEQVGLISASLLGSVLTLTILISIFAIYSNRATVVESSLMVAYIVKCCYELFPELSKNNISNLFKFVFNEFKKIDNQAKNSLPTDFNFSFNISNFSNVLLENETINFYLSSFHFNFPTFYLNLKRIYEIFKIYVDTIAQLIIQHFPHSFETLWDFFKISINNLTYSLLFQLAYRILVFFAGTKIIPIFSMGRSPTSSSSSTPTPTPTPTTTTSTEESMPTTSADKFETQEAGKKIKSKNSTSTSGRLIYLYSPCIIIAVYTNLMIQYNHEFDQENQVWKWLKYKIQSQSQHLPENETVHSWQFWNWINIFAVLIIYVSELLNSDPEDSLLTDHWNASE